MVLTRSQQKSTRSKEDRHKNCKPQCCYSPVKKTRKTTLETNSKSLPDDKVKKSKPNRKKSNKTKDGSCVERQNIQNHSSDLTTQNAKIGDNILDRGCSSQVNSNFKTETQPSYCLDLKVPQLMCCNDVSVPKECKSSVFTVLNNTQRVKNKPKEISFHSSSSLLLCKNEDITEEKFPNILCRISKNLITTNKHSSVKCKKNSEEKRLSQNESQNKHKVSKSNANNQVLKFVKKRFFQVHFPTLEKGRKKANIHRLLNSPVKSSVLRSSPVNKETDTQTFRKHSQLQTNFSKKESKEKANAYISKSFLKSICNENLNPSNMKKGIIKVKKVSIFQNNDFIIKKVPLSKEALTDTVSGKNKPILKDKIGGTLLSFRNMVKQNSNSLADNNQAKAESKNVKRNSAETCPYCHKFAWNKIEALQGHVFKQHLMCHRCKQSFATEEDMETHRIERHKREKQYCLACDRVLYSAPFYRKHIKSKYHEKLAALAENKALKEILKQNRTKNRAEFVTVESAFKSQLSEFFENISPCKEYALRCSENPSVHTSSGLVDTVNSTVSMSQDDSMPYSSASIPEPCIENVIDTTSSSQEGQNPTGTYENHGHNADNINANYFDECLVKEEPKFPEIIENYNDCMESSFQDFNHPNGIDVQNNASAPYMDSNSDISLDSSALKPFCDNYALPCGSKITDKSKISIQASSSYTELVPVKNPLSLNRPFLNYINANSEYTNLVSYTPRYSSQVVPNYSSSFRDFNHPSGTGVRNSASASFMDSKVSDISLNSSGLKPFCDANSEYTNLINANSQYTNLVSSSQGYTPQVVPNYSSSFRDFNHPSGTGVRNNASASFMDSKVSDISLNSSGLKPFCDANSEYTNLINANSQYTNLVSYTPRYSPQVVPNYSSSFRDFNHPSGTGVQNNASASFMDSKVSDISLNSSGLKLSCDNYALPCGSKITDSSKNSIQASPSYIELVPVKNPLSLNRSFLNYININTKYTNLVSYTPRYSSQVVPNYSSSFTGNVVSPKMYNQFSLF